MACRVRVWGIRGDARGDTPCRVSERESESGDGRAAGGRGRGIQKAYWRCVCASFSDPPLVPPLLSFPTPPSTQSSIPPSSIHPPIDPIPHPHNPPYLHPFTYSSCRYLLHGSMHMERAINHNLLHLARRFYFMFLEGFPTDWQQLLGEVRFTIKSD